MTDATRRRQQGWPARMMDAFGMKAELRRDLQSGFMTIPAGYIVTIEDNSIGWDKLAIKGTACICCGCKPHMTRVPWRDLKYLGDVK